MKIQYTLSCYAPRTYVFSIPLRASEYWLKKILRRTALINGAPLTEKQVTVLCRRAVNGVEVGYYSKLEYVLEGQTRG